MAGLRLLLARHSTVVKCSLWLFRENHLHPLTEDPALSKLGARILPVAMNHAILVSEVLCAH